MDEKKRMTKGVTVIAIRLVCGSIIIATSMQCPVEAFALASLPHSSSHTNRQLLSRLPFHLYNRNCVGRKNILRSGSTGMFLRLSSEDNNVDLDEYNDLPLIHTTISEEDDHKPLRPSPGLLPEEIPTRLMMALAPNRINVPHPHAGLETMWEFAGGDTQYIFRYNRTEFIESALETADQWSVSFYGMAMKGREWCMEGGINRVGGNDGWIATQVMRCVSDDGRLRRWQWELRKNRRPPDMNCWFVHSIGSSDRKGNFEPD